MTYPVIGFVTGLTAEAKLLENTGFLVAAGGGWPGGGLWGPRASDRAGGPGARQLRPRGRAGARCRTRLSARAQGGGGRRGTLSVRSSADRFPLRIDG